MAGTKTKKQINSYKIGGRWLFVADTGILYYVTETSLGRKFFVPAIKVDKIGNRIEKSYNMDVPMGVVRRVDKIVGDRVRC